MFKKVGLIGVGAMGGALLHRLRLAGVDVLAYDLSNECLVNAKQAGAEIVSSSSEATVGVEAVHIFVRTDEDVLDCVLGSSGVLSGAVPGTVLMIHSTVMPQTTKRIAERAQQKNVKAIDVPVTALPARVRDGEAVFLAGGMQEDVERVRPHLERLGKAVYHFGPLGSGNVAKIAKNLATAIDRVAAAEIVWLAEAGGVDPLKFLEMMRIEFAQPIMQRWEFAFTVENGHAVPRPATNLLNKDVALAVELSTTHELNAPITQAVAQTAARWVAQWNKGEKAS